MTPLLMKNVLTQHFHHHDDDFQLNMYKHGLQQPEETTYSNCIVMFTYSGDVEASQISFDLARRGIRFVRIDSDSIAGTCIDEIDSLGRLIVGKEVLEPKVLWKRHFFPQHCGSTGQMTADYVISQTKSLVDAITS